jgi:hypothetical protein
MFFCTTMAAIAMAVLFIPSAFAVHDTGYFELDGNATSASGTGGAIPDDWDRVCFQVTGNSACGTTSPTHQQAGAGTFGSNAVAWTGDCPVGQSGFGCTNNNATIFTGGGSKDPQDINNWAWKDGAGGLPDKDNLVHAFAARYSIQGTTSAGTCPNGTDLNGGTFNSSVACQVIYFGSDRFDNSGDAQQGFWFLQNAIGLGTNAVGGGSGFTSNNPSSFHRNGDVLVVSDFSNGGGTATITVYQWDTTCKKAASSPQPGDCGDVNLRERETSTQALCGASLAGNDGFCGITNPSNGTPVPWSSDYTDKSGNSSYLQGEFFEAGINLSTLGLGGECFSSVESETRSSTSTTATLKDFVLGSFAPCGATIHTTPSADTTDAGSVSPGTAVSDLATIMGTGVTNPPFPSSPPNVTFFLCNAATVIANNGDCHTGGTQVGVTKALSATATQGVSTATSDPVNAGTSASPALTPGTYCFRAEWPGNNNYPGLIKDGSTTECFTVRTVPTSTTTTPWSAGDATGHALGTGTLALGTNLFDKAVVQGTAAGGSPPGNVNFFICDPGHLTGTPGNETCPSGTGTALSGNPRALLADSDSTPPTSTAFSSPAVVANNAGVWCFRAEYVHSGSTYQDSSDARHSECVTVGPENTTTTTTPLLNGTTTIIGALTVGSHVSDHAVIAAVDSVDGVPTGTVDFFICDPSVTFVSLTGNCATGGVSAGAGKPMTASNPATTPPSATADSDSVTANAVGLWCFRAVYTPSGSNGANYNGSSDPAAASTSTTECFTVQDSTSMSSGQTWVPNDTATVAVTGGTALNGTLSIQLYEGTCNAGQTDVAATATPVGSAYTKPLTNATSAADRTLTTTNSTAYLASKSIAWLVKFTPTAGSNVTGSQHCEFSSVSITN